MTVTQKETHAYTSAEFQLESPGIFFQFKLRATGSEPMFALVNKASKAMASLTPGDLIPMIYHFQDKTLPSERRVTRIKYVQDGDQLGHSDHFIVGLEINEDTSRRRNDNRN